MTVPDSAVQVTSPNEIALRVLPAGPYITHGSSPVPHSGLAAVGSSMKVLKNSVSPCPLEGAMTGLLL